MASANNVMDFRRRIKFSLAEAFGNKCYICHDSYPVYVYDFHHIDPSTKSFGLSANGITRSRQSCADEAEKCIMVCANCHREIEHGDCQVELISNFDANIYWNTLKEITTPMAVEKVKTISREELKDLIRLMPFRALARQLDISDNTLRKWCSDYHLPSLVGTIQQISDEDWINI